MAKGKKKQPKPSQDQSVTNVVNDTDERRKFKTMLVTITEYMKQIEDSREAIKETIGDASSGTGIEKKQIKKLANTMFKHNYASLQEENRHFEILYETLVEGRLPVADLDYEEKLAA